MADSLGFLRELKQTVPSRRDNEPFLFLLSTNEGNPTVSTISPEHRPINVNPDDYSGAPARMLAFMESVAPYPFSSGNDFYLYPEPIGAMRLAECDNVVVEESDTRLTPVKSGVATLVLRIEADEEDESKLVPKLRLRCTDGTVASRFFLLSDSLACDYSRFVFVDSVGENFSQLNIFLHDFPADMLPDYLAIFLSYIKNVKIEIPGRKIRFGDVIPCHRAIVIEKMDTDHALYVSARSLPPGDHDGELLELASTYIVRDNENGSLTAYPLDFEDNTTLTAKLYDIICDYAPSKTERNYVYNDGSVIIVPEATASAFLLQGLPKLLKDYSILGLDRIKDYKLRPVSPRLNVKFSSGINFLEGSADIDIEGQTFTILDVLKQYKANKYVTMADGSRAILDDKFIRRIERVFGSNIEGDKIKISYFDLPEIEQYIESNERNNEVLRKPREFYAGFNELAKAKLTLPRINATLRKYQEDGVKWLDYLYEHNIGGCLADDMGLGKTLQIICLIEKHLDDNSSELPVLIVMPRSLLFNWESEFKKFAPHIDVAMYYGTNRDFDEAMQHRVILTTYAMVRNDIEKFKEKTFQAVILDESQTIKNPESQQSKAVAMLKGEHRFAMSGTPIENNLGELYALFRFINPGMLGNFDDFQSRYLNPIQRDHDEDALKSLRTKIYPFMLRRLKKDVLHDLPDRIDNTIYVDMEPAHATFYEERRRKLQEQMNITMQTEGINKARFMMLQAIGELRRIASVPESATDGSIASPKLDLLVEQISQAVENGHKVVVFFNFIAGLELLAERLNAIGITTETMTGATRDRKSIVESFQESDDVKVLAMTLKTGGVGLNLTAADIVFIAEPWWNVAAQEQAINRLYRMGQKNTVFSYSLITRDTIEEKIEQLQKMKSDLFNDVIATDESTAKQLTEEDINFILS